MNKIIKIAVFGLISLGFGLNANIKDYVMNNKSSLTTLLISAKLCYAACDNYMKNGDSYLNTKFNLGYKETAAAAIGGVMGSIANLYFQSGKLGNYFAYCFLGTLLFNRVLRIKQVAKLFGADDKVEESCKNISQSIMVIGHTNKERMREENLRLNIYRYIYFCVYSYCGYCYLKSQFESVKPHFEKKIRPMIAKFL